MCFLAFLPICMCSDVLLVTQIATLGGLMPGAQLMTNQGLPLPQEPPQTFTNMFLSRPPKDKETSNGNKSGEKKSTIFGKLKKQRGH